MLREIRRNHLLGVQELRVCALDMNEPAGNEIFAPVGQFARDTLVFGNEGILFLPAHSTPLLSRKAFRICVVQIVHTVVVGVPFVVLARDRKDQEVWDARAKIVDRHGAAAAVAGRVRWQTCLQWWGLTHYRNTIYLRQALLPHVTRT